MLLQESPSAVEVRPAGPWAPARSRAGWVAILLGASIVLAALSLLLPSTPTYDPWAWIIWGREVAHLDLSTTSGPSWKPLPVVFTTVFSLFGGAAPYLWLVVARAGAIAGVVLAFRVTRRLGGGMAGGLAAAAALALAPWWIRNVALGNSEGLMVAFVLAAVDRHLAGDRRAAFLLGALAGLLRPEAWPFLALYGVWGVGRRWLPAPLVVGVGVGVLALWILPEWWGSGEPLRAASRAKVVNPGAPTYAPDPVGALFTNAGDMLTAPVLLGLALAAVVALVRRDRAMLGLGICAVAWLGLVAYMTNDGFSGNQRYLVVPVALLIVLGAAAAGGRVARIASPRLAVGAGALLVAAFALPSKDDLRPMFRDVAHEAHVTHELPAVLARAGRLPNCGAPTTGAFLVPQVAWRLGLHQSQVAYLPARRAVFLRVRAGRRTDRFTPGGPAARPGLPVLATGDHWRIVSACGPGGA